MPVPRTLEEAFAILDQMVCDEDRKAIIEGEDFSGEIRTFVTDEQEQIEKDSDGPQVCTAVLLGSSAQGVEITYFYHPQNAHMHFP